MKNQLIILNADESDQKSHRDVRAINTQLGREDLNVSGDPCGIREIRGSCGPNRCRKCNANARPLHELKSLWLTGGVLIVNSGVLHTMDDPWNRKLALLSANLTQYMCHQLRLGLGGGFPTVKSTAMARVQGTPTFFSLLRSETLGEYGALLIVPCDVIGEPMPHLTWLSNVETFDMSGDR